MLLGTQDKDFFPEDITEKFRFVKEMGFDCFEIDEKGGSGYRTFRMHGLRRLPGMDRRFY